MEQAIQVLFLSQDSGLAEAIGRALGDGFVTHASKEVQVSRLVELRGWCDVIVMDLRPAAIHGDFERALQMMQEIGEIPSHAPVVVLYDGDNRRLFLGAMDRGAFDSATMPPNMVELRLILRRASKFHATEAELGRLRAEAQRAGRLHELLGTSREMQELFSLAQKVAPCDVNVLITGESGTGKELLARAIHRMSARNTRPLVAFSCVNLPESLIEDELFGHEKGAFTGALTARAGRFEAANHGTLFLDEIGDLSLGLQPKLLRVLQERSFQRLGSNATTNVNIRQISATNRNLTEMVQQGKFREDLYYRLNVVQLHLPPLRDRRDDIPVLAHHFLENCSRQFNRKARRFSQVALRALEEYSWPGNVRELENTIQRAVVLSDGHTVDIGQLSAVVREGCCVPGPARSYEEEVRQFKKRLVVRTLRECGWRKAESARMLGMARGYLHRLINQLEIQQPYEELPAKAADMVRSSGQIM